MDDSMDDSMDQSNHLTKRQKTHNGIQIHQYDTQTISNSTFNNLTFQCLFQIKPRPKDLKLIICNIHNIRKWNNQIKYYPIKIDNYFYWMAFKINNI